MADSAVAVTAGAGTNIDTRTESSNGNHRAVVVLGDPTTNAGVAPVDGTAGLKVDLGTDNDITGTVTANLSATDNTVLDNIDTSTTGILADTAAIEIATEATQAALETAGGLVVNLGANNDVTVTGTVTANAGTNLNTSALAIETGGNLASVKTNTDKIPALGQALAAASVPVVLTAAQISTITPPAAITGFATSANQLADGHNVTVDNASGVAAVNIQDGGNTITVDGTVGVTGVSTLAEQQSQTTHLATIAGDTTSIQTAVETIDNAISGSEMQVDVVAALPAGTNAIGKLAANSGVDIGDVDVTSLPALVAGTAAIGKVLPPDVDITTHTNYIKKYYTNAGAVTDGIVWSPAAGKRWHVVSMYLQVSAAATITLEDDKSGGDEAVWKGEFAANQGMTINFSELYPFASGEDAADLIVTTSAGNIYITITGYEI